METVKLADVFKKSGTPTHTFVEPKEYTAIRVSLDTPGRGLVVEGPSGIGKTTAVKKALDSVFRDKEYKMLRARNPKDRLSIGRISERAKGIIVIDDFHRLDDEIKEDIAERLKDLADTEDNETKLVLIGINKAGQNLVRFAKDVVSRIDIIEFEANSDEKILELISKGEIALNIKFSDCNSIVRECIGSFSIAQNLAHSLCLDHDIIERQAVSRPVSVSMPRVRDRVWGELSRVFLPIARTFARGKKFKAAGRAPYLHLLQWLAESGEFSIDLEAQVNQHPHLRGSINQIVEKNHLSSFIEEDDQLKEIFHFDASTGILAVEDPQFIYFLRNTLWMKFAREVGYKGTRYRSKYDFALSFAGEDRKVAKLLCDFLVNEEMSVFYDHDEQHLIAGEEIEDYLAPIYKSEATFVIPILSADFPKKIWTKFESENFSNRFGKGSVIPIWLQDGGPSAFDRARAIGGFHIKESDNLDERIPEIGRTLVKKISDQRNG